MSLRPAFRFTPTALLAASVLLAASHSAGCASQGHSKPGSQEPDINLNFDAGQSSGGPVTFAGDCPPDLQSVTITPATTTVSFVYGQKPPTVTLTASGKFSGGHTMDVTSCAGWTSSPLGMASAGSFTPPGAGQFTITAGSGTVSGSATVTVKVTGAANAGGIDTTKLDGTPGSGSPTIAYPLDGSLFPYHFGDLAFQMEPNTAGQSLARVHFAGDAIDLDVYAPCSPIAGAAVSGACSVALPADVEDDLVGASSAPNLKETVRLAASDGSSLAESASIDARWSSSLLPGTIYYWSTPPHGNTGASEIVRMNLAKPGTPPEVYYTNLDAVPYASPLSGGWACVGCHAISRDGAKLGITIGGSSVNANGDGYGSLFALLDVKTKKATATRITEASGNQLLSAGFAEMTTFTDDGSYMVQELQGQLFVRTADSTLASTGPLFSSMSESMTMPSLSQNGDRLVFASWMPTLSIPHSYDSKDTNGNETPSAQIWSATVSGTTFGSPSLIVPRVAGATEYYPALSDDSAYVVFNESSCAGPSTNGMDGYGTSPCDSYDDPSARLRMVSSDGGTPVELDRASGRTSGWPTSATWTNSWPTFSPSHGTFQGKTLYWVAFSSRRAYGATLSGSANGSTPPQIWFAGVAVDAGGHLSGDPSFAPVWLPMQNSATPEVLPDGGTSQTLGGDGTPTGNHIPQWVVTYVKYVPPPLM